MPCKCHAAHIEAPEHRRPQALRDYEVHDVLRVPVRLVRIHRRLCTYRRPDRSRAHCPEPQLLGGVNLKSHEGAHALSSA